MNILCTYILSWLLFYLLPVNEGSHFADVGENEDSGHPLHAIIPGTGLILVALLIFMMRLRRSQKNKCRSAHLDHSALDVQVTN
ncbi:hypothetical protein AAFF_G00435880 [Aldrovandia affinis]|uniref:Uncharacterized protein n=1 Tax=Aldrovandia affinis TaxID=143900 RepID=A0AAD7VXN6_9TELE|nr:hypothetical protein AAFF_G00435880 [Aldrovandia affinis]